MFIKKPFKYLYHAVIFVWEKLLRLVIINLSDGRSKFNLIYKLKYWSGPLSDSSVSGYGSDRVATKNIINNLELFIKKNKIKTILDIPCGDFSWMQNVDLSGVKYIGADIVKDLISKNQSLYDSKFVSFEVMDLMNDILPQVDLIFVRDCFIHLSNKDVIKSINNIKKSKSNFLATTSFSNEEVVNANIVTGDFRFINLLKSPFLLPKPFEVLDDNFDNKDKIYSYKNISIWKLDEI